MQMFFSNRKSQQAKIDLLTLAVAQLLATHPERQEFERELRASSTMNALDAPSRQYAKAYADATERLLRAVAADDESEDARPKPIETIFRVICAALYPRQRNAIAEQLKDRAPAAGTSWAERFAEIVDAAEPATHE